MSDVSVPAKRRTNNPLDPWDPKCGRFATEIEELDVSIMDGPDVSAPTEAERAGYIVYEEGTYNRENGHFLCDRCYIDAGMPSLPGSWWKCP